MAKITYHLFGKVTNGNLVHYNYPLFKQVLSQLEGLEFDLVLKEKHKNVSLDTHGFYRAGVIKECLNYEMFGGWTDDECHEFFADMFLSYVKTIKVITSQGTAYREKRETASTAGLNQREMNEYVDLVITWLAGQGIVIQSPESYFLGKYKTQKTDETNTNDQATE